MLTKDQFHVNEFLSNQKSIWTKYHSIEDGLSLLHSEKEFIDKLDKYILHAIEELYEVKHEYQHCMDTCGLFPNIQRKINANEMTYWEGNKLICTYSNDTNYRDYIFELIDVLMYIGTITSIIDENIKLIKGNNYTDEDIVIMLNADPMTVDEFIIETMDKLIEIRIPFKKRKWHKHSEEMSNADKLCTLIEIKNMLLDLIKSVLVFTISQTNNRSLTIEQLLDAISQKQGFIKDLKETN